MSGAFGKHLAGLLDPSSLRSAMRSVSYVQRVALEFSGSLFPHAICLGDVDNDKVSACALEETQPCLSRAGSGRGQESGPRCQGRLRNRACVADLGKNFAVSISVPGRPDRV